jgi:hypothetical protein
MMWVEVRDSPFPLFPLQAAGQGVDHAQAARTGLVRSSRWTSNSEFLAQQDELRGRGTADRLSAYPATDVRGL